MKKIIALVLALVLVLSLCACGKKSEGISIAVPNDATNEARALLLLEDLGLIKLKEDAGITATVLDIAENPHNISFKEIEAAQLPNVRQDVDFAVINCNYALEAGLKPTSDALGIEGSASAYGNIVCVKEGNEEADWAKALSAAVRSQQVKDFITEKYDGAVISIVNDPTDGFDPDVDYAALAGTTISIAASPTPHAEVLQIARDILAEKDITLDIIEYTDYVVPNNVVESGEVDANYFQHIPYLDDFNAQNGTHIVSVCAIHVEPMGVYAGKLSDLSAIK